ncbi:MAG: hypothetical protein AAGH89_12760 [Verrucomicrobiota bacterium]
MTSENSTTSGDSPSSILPAFAFSPSRVWVLAQSTIVQLVRMKVFYFLLVFAALILVIVAIGLLWRPVDHLLQIKRWSFGAMYVFSMVYSISATSLLLPRDVEDRTLYTILSKPVPRFEYLAGRLLGVISVNAIAMFAMFGLMCVLVMWKIPAVEEQMMNELRAAANGEAISLEDQERTLAAARQQGVTLSLFWGFWALILKASVITVVTLFVSTFATSSLFTIVSTTMIVFIGHFHQIAMDYWFQEGIGLGGIIVSNLLRLMFPNLAMFDVVDEVITGSTLATGAALQMTGLGFFYLALFLVLSQLIFVDKEL